MYKHYSWVRMAALAVPALFLLSACSAVSPEVGAEPVPVGEPPTRPLSDPGPEGFFPGFHPVSNVEIDSAPKGAGTAFAGSVFPAGGREDLSFYGFNPAGALWRIDTNPSCVGSVVTRVGGEPSIVILDSDARTAGQGPVSVTVASAFAMDDGERLWGPTKVPGPSTGGLIFANTPKGLSAEKAPGTVLDADTGAVLEADPGLGAAVYEHHGTVLFDSGAALTAVDAGSGEALWSTGEVSRPPGAAPDARPVFRGHYGPSSGGVVILEWATAAGAGVPVAYDLLTGGNLVQVPGEPAGIAKVDDASGLTLLPARQANGAYTLTAVHPGRGLLWRQEFRSLEVTAVGGGAVYARINGAAARIDLDSGAVLESGQFVLPEAVLADGSAIFPARDSSTGYVLGKRDPRPGP